MARAWHALPASRQRRRGRQLRSGAVRNAHQIPWVARYAEPVTASGEDVLQRYLAHPPVIEAVAGIEFRSRPMDVVALVHEATQWADRFPVVTAQPPLPPSQPFAQSNAGFEFQVVPGFGPSRLWSVSGDGIWLAQTQEDRLLVNWRQATEGSTYAGFGAIREELMRLYGLLHRPQDGPLSPLVAEFTYVNRIETDLRELHSTFSIFRKPERGMPGNVVTQRYEAIAQVPYEFGTGQLTVSIQPGEPPSTMLTITTKVFAGRALAEDDFINLVDAAHDTSKQAFFAVVSDATTSRWERS